MPLLLALLVLLLLVPSAGAAVPEGAVHEEAEIASTDGTLLAADVFRPAGGRVPVVLDAGPYFGRFGQDEPAPASPDPALAGLPARGIAVVDLSLRGYGGSGGCVDFHGAADRRDLRAAIAWAKAQPWSNGRVAVAGFSYDGGAAVNALAAASDLLDAAVLISPQADAYDTLFHQGVHFGQPATTNVFGAGLSGTDALGPDLGSSPGRELRNVQSADPACWASFAQGVEQADRDHPFWRGRHPSAEAAGTRVPVLLSYGFEDTTTRLTDVLAALRGPVRAWLGQWDHDEPSGRDGFRAELAAFLGHHLRGEGDAPPAGAVVQEGRGGWRAERTWPPAGTGELALPILPGTYRDAPGNTADARDLAAVPIAGRVGPSPVQGSGSWTFTPPLETVRHLAGEPAAEVRAPAGAQVVALLYDVAPDGRASFVTRGAARLEADGTTAVRLLGQDWRFAPGHRIGLLLSGADEHAYRPGTSGRDVAVGGGTLRLPVLRAPAGEPLDGEPGRWFAARRPFAVDPALVAQRTAPGR